MENTIQAKESSLRELGFREVQTIQVNGYDTEYNFEDDGRPCAIFEREFEIGDTVGDILSAADFYSCCGDILDKDLMMCPSCKEHC